MIGKTITGKGFGGAIRYIMEKENAELLLKSGVCGDDPNYIAKQFIAVADEKRNVSKPVWHTSISFAYDDEVTNETMIDIAKDYLKELGFDLNQNQFIIVKHNDTEHLHFHLLCNRIGYDGKVVNDYYCKNRTARACDKLELKYNLTIAREQENKTYKDKIPVKENYKKKISENLYYALFQKKVGSFIELSDILSANNIEMILHRQSTGRVYGISFQVDKWKFKGSSINKKFSLKKIEAILENNRNPEFSVNTSYEQIKSGEKHRQTDFIEHDKNFNPGIPLNINNGYGYKDEDEEEIKKKKKKRKRSNNNDLTR